ncbi:F-box domain containing protein [Aphelenchoides avenae]|nr:F-box domain containing protein [Aphelenchus avenae]
MPDAVLWQLFLCSGVKELVQLGRTSGRMYKLVRQFVHSTAAALLRQNRVGHDHKARIELAVRLYAKMRGHTHDEDDGLFIAKFCHGWSEKHCFSFLQRFVNVQLVTDVAAVLNRLASDDDEDRDTEEELRVRRMVHFFFTYENGGLGKSKAFTASAAMRLLCSPDQRHLLLMLLYAPVMHDAHGNEVVRIPGVNDPKVTRFEQIYDTFGMMPLVCEQLIEARHSLPDELRWTDKEVFDLIEDLTTFTDPWAVENFAAFLVCRPAVAFLAVALRAVNDYVPDAGFILFHLIEISTKMGRICHMSLKEAMSDLATSLPRSLLAKLQSAVFEQSEAQLSVAWTPILATNDFDRKTLVQEFQLSADIAAFFGYAASCLHPRGHP